MPLSSLSLRRRIANQNLLLLVFAMAMAYLLTGLLGFSLTLFSYKAIIFWPPAGLAMGAVFLFGRRLALGIWIGAFLLNIFFFQQESDPWLVSMGFSFLMASGATLQAVLGAAILTCFRDKLNRIGYAFVLAMLTLMVCLVSSVSGVSALWLSGRVSTAFVLPVFWTWILGDTLGIWLFFPLLLLFVNYPPVFNLRKCIAFCFYFLLLGSLLNMLFLHSQPPGYPIAWILYAMGMWSAFAFGRHGVLVCNLFIACVAAWGTSLGLGIFAGLEGKESLYLLQGYIGVLSLSSLWLSLLLDEKEKAYAQLWQANQSKSDFMAKMSHELRTPLNAVIGFSSHLERGMGADTQQLVMLQRIKANGMHLLNLVNDILDISRIEAQQMALHMETVAPGEVLQQVLQNIQVLAEQRNIHLSYTNLYPGGCWRVDQEKLKQIFLNLLSNALKFTPEHGRVEVSVQRQERLLKVTVTDSGPGISLDKQGIIFEPFQQAETTSPQAQAGTGLGLSISRSLAAAMSLTFFLEHSALGEGSTFTLQGELHIPEAPNLNQSIT